ncbi:MAG: hypothetical protein IIC56_06470, partial [Proteobacteria bacterium]|nr:hypothetical protein [Pseudomonadota bacterium]
MRDGGAAQAGKLFRKVRKAEDQNIAAYAQACIDLLKRYKDFSFAGEPLSKKSAFVKAGERMAHEFVRKARDDLANAKNLEGKSRGEYFSSIGLAKKHEPALNTAAVFLGTEPEDELIRVWKLAFNASLRELARIDEEIAEKSGRRGGRGGSRGRGRGRGGSAVQREIAELNEHKERVFKTAETYFWKLQDYG